MPTGSYQTAVKLLVDTFGTLCTYTKVSTGTYDVATGNIVNSEQTFSVKLSKSMPRFKETDSPHLIGKEVAIFYMAVNTSVTPSIGDIIIFSGVKYEIADFMEQRAPSGLIAGYRLIATRG